jgi:hypothetical protein
MWAAARAWTHHRRLPGRTARPGRQHRIGQCPTSQGDRHSERGRRPRYGKGAGRLGRPTTAVGGPVSERPVCVRGSGTPSACRAGAAQSLTGRRGASKVNLVRSPPGTTPARRTMGQARRTSVVGRSTRGPLRSMTLDQATGPVTWPGIEAPTDASPTARLEGSLPPHEVAQQHGFARKVHTIDRLEYIAARPALLVHRARCGTSDARSARAAATNSPNTTTPLLCAPSP